MRYLPRAAATIEDRHFVLGLVLFFGPVGGIVLIFSLITVLCFGLVEASVVILTRWLMRSKDEVEQ